MSKTNTTLTIEPDLLLEAKSLNICLSQTLGEALRAKIGAYKGDLNDVNLVILNQKIVILQNSLTKQNVELNELLSQKKRIEALLEEEKEKDLKIMQDRLEKEKVCSICGEFFSENRKRHGSANVIICVSCYNSATYDQRKAWRVE